MEQKGMGDWIKHVFVPIVQLTRSTQAGSELYSYLALHKVI